MISTIIDGRQWCLARKIKDVHELLATIIYFQLLMSAFNFKMNLGYKHAL